MLRWLRRTWVKLLQVGGLIGVLELLVDIWSVAGDLFASLQQPGPDVLPAALRFGALVLFPLFAWGTLVTVIGAIRVAAEWLVPLLDAYRTNDRWAVRQLHTWLPEIERCVHELENSGLSHGHLLGYPALHTRLHALADALSGLGIRVVPDDALAAVAWHRRLASLAVLVSYGHIKAARSLDTSPLGHYTSDID